MKKIFLITIMSMVAFTSCNDALDILPEDQIPAENAFTNVDDLQNGLNGIYRIYDPSNTIDYSSNNVDDTKIGADNGGQKINFHNLVLQSNSAESQAMWLNNYATINLINRVIAAASSITPQTSEAQTQYNKILGDCYALRAYLHLELLAYYGLDYTASAEGIPYADFVVVFEQLARNTAGEVFTKIYEDLGTAFGLIDASFTDNGFVTRDFITATRARAALYEGNSTLALASAQNLIVKYPLADQTQYVNMFKDADNTEVIFKWLRTDGNNDQRIGGVWYFTGTGGAFMEMSNGFYNLITADGTDIRGSVNVDPISVPGDNLHFIGKYLGKGGFDYLNDVKVYRVSEMYLIKAEILAKSNDFVGAANQLKFIRDARTGTDTALSEFTTLVDAMDEILLERRKELSYEGHRYVDLKRTRSITGNGFIRDAADCGGATPCELVQNDFRWTFPIPNSELNGNPNITQAPGY